MRRKEKVYISGRISGLGREVYTGKFSKAEELIRANGYKTVNPTHFLVCRWRWLYRIVGYERTLLYDIWRLWQCDRIYLIPGWMDSRGARIESFAAHVMRVRRLPIEIKDGIDDAMEKWMSENGIHVLTQAEFERMKEKI
jgi:hypothetical protein